MICAQAVAQSDSIVPSGFDRLDQWYTANAMENILINNAGDPFAQSGALSSLTFEREVIPAGTMNTATPYSSADPPPTS